MKVSVVVPTLCRDGYISYLIKALERQRRKPDEVVLIYKCDEKLVKLLTSSVKGLSVEAEPQRRLGFTGALNQGIESSTGDIIIFLDDDVIPNRSLVENYVKLLEALPQKVAGACSRDVPYDLSAQRPLRAPDDEPLVKIYRQTYVRFFERPHAGLEQFRQGVFVTRDLRVAHGPCIPDEACVSLPFRGANMAFRREAIEDVRLPEHPRLGAARGNEQLLGVYLAVKGFLYVYVPDNPVLHLVHGSLSRSPPDPYENYLIRLYLGEALERLGPSKL